MQTFLPEPDFVKSARILDKRRCWKQILEAKQLLQGGWPHHPASKMWNGYHDALGLYLNIMLEEWKRRGGMNFSVYPVDVKIPIKYPPWIGNEKFHNSHKSKLLFKGECEEVRRVLEDKYSIKIHKFCEERSYTSYKKWTYNDLDFIKKEEFIIPMQIHNHYAQFGWNVPMNLDYIWPV